MLPVGQVRKRPSVPLPWGQCHRHLGSGLESPLQNQHRQREAAEQGQWRAAPKRMAYKGCIKKVMGASSLPLHGLLDTCFCPYFSRHGDNTVLRLPGTGREDSCLPGGQLPLIDSLELLTDPAQDGLTQVLDNKWCRKATPLVCRDPQRNRGSWETL